MKWLDGYRIRLMLIGLVTAIVLSSAGSARAATWTQKADMPTARHGLSTSVVDGKIYAFGGTGGLKKVEEYNPATDTWTEKADMPTGRVSLASSAVDGKIYAIGGMTVYRGTYLATVEEYDPATDTWTQKADMPAPRATLDTSVVNGRIYAIGGGDKRGSYTATVWEYDPATDTWTTKADMPTARKFAPTSVVNGKIYAFGGHRPNASPTYSIVEEYDPVADRWTKKADMPAPRSWGSASMVDEKIYAFGGYASKGGVPLSTLFQYEPATDTWTAKDDMPVRMGGLSTSVVGGRIYVIGGTSALYPYNQSLSTVWEYDPNPLVVDFNGDEIVDIYDLLILIEHWGQDEPSVDMGPMPWGDGIVDVQDLEVLMSYWGQELEYPTLVAHWALDEAEGDIAYDSVAVNDAVVFGDAVWQPTAGKIDGALQFDGIDDYVSADLMLNRAAAKFSVFIWVKGGMPGQIVFSQAAVSDWLGADMTNGSLMTELRFPFKPSLPLQSQTVITDGNWHRIGLVWDGSNRILYADAVEVASDTYDKGWLIGGLQIGAGKNLDAGSFFSGLIDDVRIYDRAITP